MSLEESKQFTVFGTVSDLFCCSAGLGPFRASVHCLTTGVFEGGQVASTRLKVAFFQIVDS